jgi:hypothetical protein
MEAARQQHGSRAGARNRPQACSRTATIFAAHFPTPFPTPDPIA